MSGGWGVWIGGVVVVLIGFCDVWGWGFDFWGDLYEWVVCGGGFVMMFELVICVIEVMLVFVMI